MTVTDTVRGEPEVTRYQTDVGTAGPYNFNGLVRHYDLRQAPTSRTFLMKRREPRKLARGL